MYFPSTIEPKNEEGEYNNSFFDGGKAYVAFSKGRYQGATGEYTIWEKGAYDYWNVAGPKQKGGQA